MGNDMMWEQKCRISALRAACASSYLGEPRPFTTIANIDEVTIERILTRAETFRVALLHDGPLDADVNEDVIRGTQCPKCGSYSRKVRHSKFLDKSWCDSNWHEEPTTTMP